MGVPSYQGQVVAIVGSVLLGLDVVFLGLRFWSRWIKKTAPRLTDYLILIAFVWATGVCVEGYLLVYKGGLGYPVTEVTTEELELDAKVFVAAPITWGVATCATKLSVLCFYHDVFRQRRSLHAVWAVGSVVAALLVAIIFMCFFLCRPFAYTWDKTIEGGVCGDSSTAYLIIATVNMVIDLVVIALPVPVLLKLQMSSEKKIAIFAILFVGLVVTAFSALRVYGTVILTADFTGTSFINCLAGLLEVQVGIINACLPLIQPACVSVSGFSTSLASFLQHSRRTQRSNSHKFPASPTSASNSSDGASAELQALDQTEKFSEKQRVKAKVEDEHEKAFRKMYGKGYGFYSTTAGSNVLPEGEEGMRRDLGEDMIMVRGDIDVYASPRSNVSSQGR